MRKMERHLRIESGQPIEMAVVILNSFPEFPNQGKEPGYTVYAMVASNANRDMKKIIPLVIYFTFRRLRRTWSFHVLFLQRTIKKCTKTFNARAELSLFVLLLSIKPFVPK